MEPTPPKKSIRGILLSCIAVLIIVISVITLFISTAPASFPSGTTVFLGKGSLNETLAELKKNGVIKSELLMRIVLIGNEKNIKSGDYYLERPENAFTISRRIIKGDYNIKAITVTIPEGSDRREIADIISKKLRNVDREKFIALTAQKEGYLFPDTYSFLPDATTETVIQTLENNFAKRISSIEEKIKESGRSLSDIIKMASIVEEEGRTTPTRKMVAGILWKRIEIGMPLQVDASFLYINGKNTSTLTFDDLKIDSPYNSYKYKGLPPTAISNPGLDSIIATIEPTKSNYLYFLTDKEGVMHYARTFAEHSQNQDRYLR